jgi:hypothetical protein
VAAARLFSLMFGVRPRPVLAPTALSMSVAVALLALALLLPDRGCSHSATAAELLQDSVTPATPLRPVTLRDRLLIGLEARIPSEIAYIDAVVRAVHLGLLPERMVNETFFWARQRASISRNGRLRRGIIYFQPAMNARAERLDVVLEVARLSD